MGEVSYPIFNVDGYGMTTGSRHFKCLDDEADREEDAILSIREDKTVRSDFDRQIYLDLRTREDEFKNHMFPLNIVYDYGACSDWRNDYQRFFNHDKDILDRYTDYERYIL